MVKLPSSCRVVAPDAAETQQQQEQEGDGSDRLVANSGPVKIVEQPDLSASEQDTKENDGKNANQEEEEDDDDEEEVEEVVSKGKKKRKHKKKHKKGKRKKRKTDKKDKEVEVTEVDQDDSKKEVRKYGKAGSSSSSSSAAKKKSTKKKKPYVKPEGQIFGFLKNMEKLPPKQKPSTEEVVKMNDEDEEEGETKTSKEEGEENDDDDEVEIVMETTPPATSTRPKRKSTGSAKKPTKKAKSGTFPEDSITPLAELIIEASLNNWSKASIAEKFLEKYPSHNLEARQIETQIGKMAKKKKLEDDCKARWRLEEDILAKYVLSTTLEKFNAELVKTAPLPATSFSALARSILEGTLNGSKKLEIVAAFKKNNTDYTGYNDNVVAKQISAMAKSLKKHNDFKSRLWLNDDQQEQYITKEELESFQASLDKQISENKGETSSSSTSSSSAPSTQPPKTAQDDPRIGTYSAWNEKVVTETRSHMDGGSLTLEEIKKDMSELTAQEEGNVAMFIARTVQGYRGPLEELVEHVQTRLKPTIDKTEDELRSSICLLAERKCYGVRNKKAIANQDTTELAFWRWEVANLALFPKPSAKRVEANRRALKANAKKLNACARLLKALRNNHDEKTAARASKEEETVQKAMREEEVARQKQELKLKKEAERQKEKERKEKEKLEAKRKREDEKATQVIKKKTKKNDLVGVANISSFFAKKANPEPDATATTATTTQASNTTPPPTREEADVEVKDSQVMSNDAIIDENLEKGEPINLPEYVKLLKHEHKSRLLRKRKKETQVTAEVKTTSSDEVVVIEDVVNEDDAHTAQRSKKKLFQFAENRRPPYFGTFRRRSTFVTGRRCFAKDEFFDYSVDSDDEWEDEDVDAESLADSDSEPEDAKDKELDYQDGWLMEDHLVEYADDADSGDDDDEKQQVSILKDKKHRKQDITSGVLSIKDRYAVGVIYSVEQIEDTTSQNKASKLAGFKLVFLQNEKDSVERVTSLVPPSEMDIFYETNPRPAPQQSIGSKSPESKQPEQVEENKTTPKSKKKRPEFTDEMVSTLASIAEGSTLKKEELVAAFEKQLSEVYLAEMVKLMKDGCAQKLKKLPPKTHVRQLLKEIAERKRGQQQWFVNEEVLSKFGLKRKAIITPAPASDKKKKKKAVVKPSTTSGDDKKLEGIETKGNATEKKEKVSTVTAFFKARE